MTEHLKLSVTDPSNRIDTITVKVEHEQINKEEGDPQDAFDAKYLVLPDEQPFTVGSNLTLSDGEGETTIEFEFTWGETTGNKNPADHCNETYEKTQAAEAYEFLTKFEASLENTRITYIVDVTEN